MTNHTKQIHYSQCDRKVSLFDAPLQGFRKLNFSDVLDPSPLSFGIFPKANMMKLGAQWIRKGHRLLVQIVSILVLASACWLNKFGQAI